MQKLRTFLDTSLKYIKSSSLSETYVCGECMKNTEEQRALDHFGIYENLTRK